MTVSIFGAWVDNCPQGEARFCILCVRKQWKQPKCAMCALFTLSCLHFHLSLLFSSLPSAPSRPTHPKHLLSIAASAYSTRSCCFVDIVFAQVADFSQSVVCFVVVLLFVAVVVVSVTNFAAWRSYCVCVCVCVWESQRVCALSRQRELEVIIRIHASIEWAVTAMIEPRIAR